MYSSFALLLLGGAVAGMRPMLELFAALQEAGAEVRAFLATQARLTRELKDLGYPIITESICYAPFDMVGDCLRGMRGVMLDMYRQPERLLDLIEFFTPLAIDSGITQAKRSRNPRVLMPLHKGAGGFMSNEQFARFYWPGLRAMIMAQIEAGLTPVPFFQGDYTPRLQFLAELPVGKVCAWFDEVELSRAKEVLGDRMCFMGNIPPDLLVLGDPSEVVDYVRTLIEIFGDSGGLVVNGAASGIPQEARPDNVCAIKEAVMKYGILA
jgi:uroporphyrinogen-III decarboxylase